MTDPLNLSAQFAAELTGTMVDLNGLQAPVRRRVLSILRMLEEDLTRSLRNSGLDELAGSRRLRRLERLLRDVRSIILKRYDQAEAVTISKLRELGTFAASDAVALLNTAITVDLFKVTLTQADLKVMAIEQLILGEPARDHWAGQAESTRRRFVREMRMGIGRGETNDELIARLRGKATGRTISIDTGRGSRRIREFAGGFMDISRSEADALVRTSAQSVGNNAIFETYQDNEDVIKGYGALTTLDGRTSKICIARTGAMWFVNGDPMPESTRQESFPGPPPWHWRCRSSLYPITYSWEELIERASGRQARALRTVPDSTRASMDGQIPNTSVRSFDDWLRIKGDSFAREKLGPGLFDLWKKDKITLSQLLDAAGNPQTLAELSR